MRELEFLPQWYIVARQRRRRLAMHGWMAAALALGLGLWMLLIHRNIRDAEICERDVYSKLAAVQHQLSEMKVLSNERQRWMQQDQMMAKLGMQVETTRMIRALDAAMPREMAMTSLQLETEERPMAAAASAAAAGTGAAQVTLVTMAAEPTPDRRLKVKVQGAAPTDVDVANFVTQLAAVPFFEQLAITYAREAAHEGRVMREFEVTFSMSLNTPAGW